jgi:PmbA protein
MNRKERLEMAGWAVDFARKNGADDVAVNVSNSRDIEIEFRDGKIDKLAESTQNSLGLSVYAGNRYSSHSTNDIRKESLKKFIEEAVRMTGYLSEDPYRSLPDPKYYQGRKDVDLDIYDDTYESVGSDDRVKMAREIERIAMARSDKIISCTSYYSDNRSESVKVHSNGFEGERRSTSFAAGIEATVRDGDKGRPQDWAWAVVRHRKNLPVAEYLAKEAVNRALDKIGQKKIESGRYDMILDNRAAGRILYSMYFPITARALQQKSSFLEGKIGQRIGSDKLTLIDDPFIKSGLASSTFDGEGMALKRRVMVDKGILKQYYVDYYYGKKLEMEPTTGSATNIVFDYGDKSLDDMIRMMKRGIVVNGTIGGNSNSTTGDYSFGITGMYVEDGRIVMPVNEMNISGNLAGLWNNLVEVGNDPYEYSSMRRPSMHIKDVTFSGV